MLKYAVHSLISLLVAIYSRRKRKSSENNIFTSLIGFVQLLVAKYRDTL